MRLLAILAVMACATPAVAQNYDAPPAVSVERTGGAGGAAQASMDVRAAPEAVWAVLVDCANARRFMRELISCRILESGDGWEVREHRVRGWALRPVLRSVSRITLSPNRRFAFSRIGGDWARSEGAWVLTPIDGGRGTHVEYAIDAALSGGLPALFTQSRLVGSVRRTLADLRREAEAHPAAS